MYVAAKIKIVSCGKISQNHVRFCNKIIQKTTEMNNREFYQSSY